MLFHVILVRSLVFKPFVEVLALGDKIVMFNSIQSFRYELFQTASNKKDSINFNVERGVYE